mmetsp:Transcript_8094/g.26917  ORF Transcript_8094/g.26917 Transcript_8094/m.26917 type:complete len:505 (-) Transcript_8094:557-2071(-)
MHTSRLVLNPPLISRHTTACTGTSPTNPSPASALLSAASSGGSSAANGVADASASTSTGRRIHSSTGGALSLGAGAAAAAERPRRRRPPPSASISISSSLCSSSEPVSESPARSSATSSAVAAVGSGAAATAAAAAAEREEQRRERERFAVAAPARGDLHRPLHERLGEHVAVLLLFARGARARGDVERAREPQPRNLGGVARERGGRDELHHARAGARALARLEPRRGAVLRARAARRRQPPLIVLTEEPVSFVDNQEAEVRKGEALGLAQVPDQPSRRGDEDVHKALAVLHEPRRLWRHSATPGCGPDAQARRSAEGSGHLEHLEREVHGWDDDERSEAAHDTSAKRRHHGEHVAERFAAARRRSYAHVAAGAQPAAHLAPHHRLHRHEPDEPLARERAAQRCVERRLERSERCRGRVRVHLHRSPHPLEHWRRLELGRWGRRSGRAPPAPPSTTLRVHLHLIFALLLLRARFRIARAVLRHLVGGGGRRLRRRRHRRRRRR